jgi:hypothetical protein
VEVLRIVGGNPLLVVAISPQRPLKPSQPYWRMSSMIFIYTSSRQQQLEEEKLEIVTLIVVEDVLIQKKIYIGLITNMNKLNIWYLQGHPNNIL